MAKLIRINPDESRDVLHDVPGIGVSARKKHADGLMNSPQEFFAVRLLKAPADQDQTEYYVEMSRAEASAVLRDFQTFIE
jgi:hypothetical protein